jgi:glycine cleavage system regulatory protein
MKIGIRVVVCRCSGSRCETVRRWEIGSHIVLVVLLRRTVQAVTMTVSLASSLRIVTARSERAMRALRAITTMRDLSVDDSSMIVLVLTRLPIDRSHTLFESLRGSKLPFTNTGPDEEDSTDGGGNYC